jgi:hypothetical protein
MAKLFLAAMAAMLLGSGCMAGGDGETEETTGDGATATAAQPLCHRVCGTRCASTLRGRQCHQQCWTQCN